MWSPPPAVASTCLEEIRKARIKRQDCTHVVLIPRLMTPLWLKQLYKAADLIFQLKPDFPHWSKQEFEPLIVAIILPFLPFHPWQYRSTPKMFSMARQMRKMSQAEGMDGGNILREFLLQTKKFPKMSPDVVRRMLYFTHPPSIPSSSDAAVLQRQGSEYKRKAHFSVGTNSPEPNGLHACKKRRSHSRSF